MRKVQLFVAVASSVVGVLVVACGSTSSNPPGSASGTDAGGDSAQGSSNGSSSGSSVDGGDSSVTSTEDAAVACVPDDADISTLSPVDAALDDAGASVGTCIACAKSNCGTDVTACNGDCSCNDALVCIFDCLGGVGNTLLTCAEGCGGVASLDSTEEGLLECAASKCKTECATASLTGGGGGGGNKDAAVDEDAAGEDGSVDAGGDAADAN